MNKKSSIKFICSYTGEHQLQKGSSNAAMKQSKA